MIGFRRRRNRRLVKRQTGGARWGWFLSAFLSVSTVLLVAFAVGWMLDPRHLPVREVRIEGQFEHLSGAHLRQVVAAQATGGFFSVDVQGIRTALKRDPWVKEAVVRRVWPDTLAVTVFEQRAIAYWGEHGLFSEEGKVFRPTADSLPKGLARLEGPEGTQLEVLGRYRQLSAWLKPFGLSVEGVELTPRRAWTFRLRGGPLVLVGRNRFDERVQRLLGVLPREVGRRVLSAAVVDLRYGNGFALRAAATGGYPRL